MKTLSKMTVIATCLFAVAPSGELSAKDFANMIKKQVVQHVKREFHHRQPVRKPHCKPGLPCPPPRPYPQPQPIVCHYFFGVWTTPVQIAPPTESPSPLTAAGVSWVTPGYSEYTVGLRIDRIVDHSPACQAGLEPGDVLLMANGHELHDKHDLNQAIRHCDGRLQCLVLDGRTGQLNTVVAYPERR